MSNPYYHPLYGVKTRRQMRNVTAAEAAQWISVHPNTFSRLERGERVMSLPRALTLASRLECTVEELAIEPTIDEQMAAMRAKLEEQHRTAATLDLAPKINDTMIPVHDRYGNIVGYQPRAARAPTTPHQPVDDEDERIAALLKQLNDDPELDGDTQ